VVRPITAGVTSRWRPTPPPPPTTPRAQRRSTVTVASTSTSRRREVAPSGRAGGGGDLWGAGPTRRHEGTKARRHEGPHVVAADRSSGVERPGSGADVAVVLTLEDRGEGCAVDLDHQAFVPSWFVRTLRRGEGWSRVSGGRGCRRGSRLRAFVPSCLRGSSDHRGGHLPLATPRHPRRRPPPELSAARPSPWRPRRRRAGGRSRRQAELVGEVNSGGRASTKARRHEGTKGLTWSPRTGPVAWSDQVPVPTSLSFSPSKTGVRAARSTSTTRPSCLRRSSDRPTGRGVVESFGGEGLSSRVSSSCLRTFVPSWFVRSPRGSPPAGDPPHPRRRPPPELSAARPSPWRRRRAGGRSRRRAELVGEVTSGGPGQHEGTKARRHEGTKGLTWSPRTGPVAWSDQVPVPTSLSFSPSKTGVRAARSTSTTRPSCLRGSSDHRGGHLPLATPRPPPPPTTPRAQRRSTVTVASTSRRREVAPSGRAGGGGDLWGAGPARRHEGTKARRASRGRRGPVQWSGATRFRCRRRCRSHPRRPG
jgi:hypothetical protein